MSRYQTRAVLAGAYKGKRANLDATRTHLVDTQDATGGEKALCGRASQLADCHASDPTEAPTCARCLTIAKRVRK